MDTRKFIRIRLDWRGLIFCAAIIVSQIGGLYFIEKQTLFFVVEIAFVLILLLSQRKYIAQVVRFGRSLLVDLRERGKE